MTDALSLFKSARSATGIALPLSLAAGGAQGFLALAIAWTISGIINAVVFGGANLPAVADSLVLLIVLYVARAVLSWLSDHAGFQAAARARRQLFRRLLDHVGALGPVRLSAIATGELATTLTDAVAAIEAYWRRWLPALATVAILPPAILLIAFPISYLAGLVFIGTLPLLLLFMVLVGTGAEQANQRQWQSLARLGGHLLDAVQGLSDLKLFGAAKREIAVVVRMAEAYRRETMSVLRLAFLSALVLEFFATLSIALVAVLVGFRLLWGEMDFRFGFFILLLAPEFFAPIRAMGAQRHARMEAIAAAERLVDLLDRPGPKARAGARRLDTGAAVALRLENVAVTYGEGRNGLDGVDFEIAAGEHVAIVGPSGAGKSTLFALLLGFVEASSGHVFADGISLAELEPESWRRLIAYVPQRPHLFDASVDDNVAMGREAANGDLDATIEAALAAARADDFVARLPQGRLTLLGERGHRLSGGETQRLALARAFFCRGPLVLLDEPTAHLDPKTEQLIRKAISDLGQGRTMITIAHRLATVRNADRIFVMHRGRIVEEGCHEALVAAGGFYARMTETARQMQKHAEPEQPICAR